MYVNCLQHLQTFSEIRVIAVSRASLLFQKKNQMLLAVKESEV